MNTQQIQGVSKLRSFLKNEDYLAITGTATVLAYNYEEQKIKKIPANFKELIEKYSIKKAIANL